MTDIATSARKLVIARPYGDRGVYIAFGVWISTDYPPELGYHRDHVTVTHEYSAFRQEWRTQLNWSALGSQERPAAVLFTELMQEAIAVAQWLENGSLSVEAALALFPAEVK